VQITKESGTQDCGGHNRVGTGNKCN